MPPADFRLPAYQYTTYGLFAVVRLKDGGFGTHDLLFGRTMLRSFTLYYGRRVRIHASIPIAREASIVSPAPV